MSNKTKREELPKFNHPKDELRRGMFQIKIKTCPTLPSWVLEMIIPGATATRVCLYSLFKWWAQISGDFKSYEAEITEKTTASVVKNSDCKNGHPLLPGLYGASIL